LSFLEHLQLFLLPTAVDLDLFHFDEMVNVLDCGFVVGLNDVALQKEPKLNGGLLNFGMLHFELSDGRPLHLNSLLLDLDDRSVLDEALVHCGILVSMGSRAVLITYVHLVLVVVTTAGATDTLSFMARHLWSAS
jgi:hypothetical protein